MRLAHVAVVTPHQAGLYETARDIAAAEKGLGTDAWIIDPVKDHSGVDRGVEYTSQIGDCDVLINHSGLNKTLNELDKPIIHILHGRPHSTFILEQAGKIPVMSYWRQIVRDEWFKAFVTFWPEFRPYFELFFPPGKIHVLTAPVDLEAWTPDGPSGYGFHGHKGKINVVCTDIWRDDKDPFHVINAFVLFAKYHPGAKLHVYAAPQKGQAWQIYLNLMRERGCLGEVCGFIKGLDNVYRAADMLITPHRIATRSVREALACGCKVVMAPGNNYGFDGQDHTYYYTPYLADPEDVEQYAMVMGEAYNNHKNNSREIAEYCFDARETASEMMRLAKGILDDGQQ